MPVAADPKWPAPAQGSGAAGSPKELVAAARRLRGDIGTVQGAPGEARSVARRLHDVARDRLVAGRLAAMPSDSLREVTGGRLRLNAVEAAGYGTVASILGSSYQQLDNVPGVGHHTASQLLGAARQVEATLGQTVRVRFDAEARPGEQAALLLALFRFDRATRVVDPLAPLLGGPARSIGAVIDDATLGSRRFRLLFARRRRKERARAALATLGAVMASEEVRSVSDRVRAALAALDEPPPSPAELWDDYTERAVSYNGLLIEVAELGPELDAAQGFVPEEIAASVRQLDLDVSGLRLSLRGYQAFGAKFALVQRRAILGDEMGLGKTVEALAAMCHLSRHGARHFLVVCPASILASWDREIQRHSDLRTHRLHGHDRRERVGAWMAEGGIAITSYETLKLVQAPPVPVAMLVVDEAHYVKNPEAQRTRTVRRWIAHAERALLLTGTPMENRVDEFRTLVGHVRPDLAKRVRPLDGLAGAAAFRRAVAPVYLRRDQSDVLDELPPRIETEEWIELEGDDLDAYRAAVASGNFMAMRRAAFLTPVPRHSAKLIRLREIVHEAVGNNRKVVVFSYFRDVLDRVCGALGDLAVGPLHGDVPPLRRDELVTQFTGHPEPLVLVSQIMVGGVGLNLQAASVVILTEPQWKPSAEDQAIARCHRMGQVHPVDVHRLLAEDSVDQRMLEVLAVKALLIESYVEVSVMKDATPEAVDVSDARLTEAAVSQVEAEQRIIERERNRLGVGGVGPGDDGRRQGPAGR